MGRRIADILSGKKNTRSRKIIEKVTPWKKLPKGWDKKSFQKFARTLTGKTKTDHEGFFYSCVDKIKDTEITDPKAFCGSLMYKYLGKKDTEESISDLGKPPDVPLGIVRRASFGRPSIYSNAIDSRLVDNGDKVLILKIVEKEGSDPYWEVILAKVLGDEVIKQEKFSTEIDAYKRYDKYLSEYPNDSLYIYPNLR